MKTLLLVTVAMVVLVLAYLTVAPRTRSMERLRVAVLGAVFLAYVGVVGAAFVELPVAVVCDMGSQNVEVKSTARRGYFEEHRIGPCVTYTQHSRPKQAGTQTSYGD
jgi:hypothetical protein